MQVAHPIKPPSLKSFARRRPSRIIYLYRHPSKSPEWEIIGIYHKYLVIYKRKMRLLNINKITVIFNLLRKIKDTRGWIVQQLLKWSHNIDNIQRFRTVWFSLVRPIYGSGTFRRRRFGAAVSALDISAPELFFLDSLFCS